MKDLLYECVDQFALAAKNADLLDESTLISGDIAHALEGTA